MFGVRVVSAAFRLVSPRLRRRTPQSPFERATRALAEQRPHEALAALEATPPDAATANKRGVALIALGRREAALEAFCDALAVDERHAPAFTNIGSLLLEDGMPSDAIDYFRAALVAQPLYGIAHRNLGVALKRLGRRREAVRALRTAARLEGRRGAGGA
jgi:Flp pilus assembly protein TadD